MTTARPTVPRPSAPHRIARRWPSAAGAAVALLAGLDVAGAGEIAPVVTASGFVYLAAAALGRRAAAWPAFAATFVLIGAARLVEGVDPTWAMLGAAAVLAVAGLVRRGVGPWWALPLQAAAMLVLGATALLAAEASGPVAALLVAGGLLAHAAWDAHHHRTGRVVVRSMAEFCAVLDALLAVLVLVAAFG
jgi:hypothetical protein